MSIASDTPSSSSAAPAPTIPTRLCAICYNQRQIGEIIHVHDAHEVCKACLLRSNESRISNHLPLSCPLCARSNAADLQVLLQHCSETQRKQVEKIHLHIAFATMKDLVYCPRVNCEGVFALMPRTKPPSAAAAAAPRSCMLVQCPACHYPICDECKAEYHGLMPCALYKQVLSAQTSLLASDRAQQEDLDKWRQANTRRCPGCAVDVEKNDGCNHMHCSQCQLEFCWYCLTAWEQHDESKCTPNEVPAARAGGGYRGGRGRGRGGVIPRAPAQTDVSSRLRETPRGGRGGRGASASSARGGRPVQLGDFLAPTAAPAVIEPIEVPAPVVSVVETFTPVISAVERRQQKKKERAEQKQKQKLLIDPKAIRRNVLD